MIPFSAKDFDVLDKRQLSRSLRVPPVVQAPIKKQSLVSNDAQGSHSEATWTERRWKKNIFLQSTKNDHANFRQVAN